MPPFPRRRIDGFALAPAGEPLAEAELDRLIDLIAAARIGGSFWGEPDLRANSAVRDPWHSVEQTNDVRDSDSDQVLVAGILGVPVRFAGDAPRMLLRSEVRDLLRERLGNCRFLDPFTGDEMSWEAVIALLSGWRQLIDGNRCLAGAYGFAAWKRATVEPLLWNGSDESIFNRPIDQLGPGQKVAIWRSRTPAKRLAELTSAGAALVEVEDGFIRSSGLGADCIPPQSIVVDEIGVHFDARGESGLERLLQKGDFSPELLARAEGLRASIVARGLTKYGAGQERLERRNGKTHVLVPGQVEDDRAVLATPGGPLSNAELLRRVREARPEAHIIYRSHPDVEAGHRAGGMSGGTDLDLADEIVRDGPITAWIDLADEVHVNSSLAGFEALMRGKPVTTYGVPFYAGWGLTDDRGAVPERRNKHRTLAELVAATLIVYPRYVDPETNLPCSPEVLIARLTDRQRQKRPGNRLLVRLRQGQGWLKRRIAHPSRRRP
jgi:capsular polysaccharide export protein